MIFGIIIDKDGVLRSVRLARVTDPRSGSIHAVDIKLHERYVMSAKKLIEEKKYKPILENVEPKEFFIYFFYDPQRPEVVITHIKK